MHETAQPTKKQRVITQMLFWGVFVALFAWVAFKNAVPTGKMVLTYTMPQGSRQFTKFQSDDDGRLVGKAAVGGKSEYLYMTKPPLTFEAYTPRSFTKATVRLTYQNPNGQPAMRLGIKQGGPGFLYRDMVVNDATLDALPAWWQKVTDGSKTLWERNADYQQKVQQNEAGKALRKKAIEKKFQQETLLLAKDRARKDISEDAYNVEIDVLTAQHDQDLAAIEGQYTVSELAMGKPAFASVADFLGLPPDPKRTLLFNTTLPPLPLPGYTQAKENTVLATSLRGSHEIVTYVGKGEKLSYAFTIQNINRHGGNDSFSVSVNDDGATVLTRKVKAIGSEKATGIPSEEQTLVVEKEGLPEGVYSLAIKTDDDVFIKRIETAQRYVMFAHAIYIAENEEYQAVLGRSTFSPTTLVTDGTTLSALTAHAAGLQTLTAGSTRLMVDQVKKIVQKKLTRPQTTLVVPKNDIKLSSDGYFAFSQDQMFTLPPQYAEYMPGMDLAGYDFILADYPQPQQQGDWLVAQTTMTNEVHMTKDHTVRLAIATPGLTENHRAMKIRSVQIIFEKHPLTPRYLWVKLTEKARKLLRR